MVPQPKTKLKGGGGNSGQNGKVFKKEIVHIG